MNTVVFRMHCAVVETGKELNTEVQVHLKGEDRWFHLMAVKLGDGMGSTGIDITERRKAQEEILRLKDEIAQKTTDKNPLIFNSIDEGLCVLYGLYCGRGQAVDFQIGRASV